MVQSPGREASLLEKAKFVVDILSGLAIPVALAVLTYTAEARHNEDAKRQTQQDAADRQAQRDREAAERDREHDDRNAELILGVGPYLFDKDPQKVQFGSSVLRYYKDLPAPLVEQLQHLNGSDNPAIAESAGQALAYSPAGPGTGAAPVPAPVPPPPPPPPPAATRPATPSTPPAASLVPSLPPAGLPGNSVVSGALAGASSQDRWMVYLDRGPYVAELKTTADKANAAFKATGVPLTAKVVELGAFAPLIYGVIVGDNIPFAQARSAREMAQSAGFANSFIIRAPGT